jgi:hypothetical protein
MRFYLKKIILSFPGSVLSAIITIIFIFKEKIKIKKYLNKRSLKLFNFNKFKNNSKNPFFILGTGSSINELSDKEKKFIEKSISCGINFFSISDLNPKYLAWEAPKKQEIQNIYMEILKYKNQRFSKNKPKLLLHDSFFKKKYKINNMFKYFESINVYSTALIKCVNDKKLDYIYKYLYNPFILKLLGPNMVYGLHSTVDRLTHLAISAGFKEIVYAGVDLNNSKYFWDKINLKNKLQNQLIKLLKKNSNEPHNIERNLGQITASKIIKSNFNYAKSQGIKLYTTSKKSKLYSFLPLYEFNK